MAGWYLNPRVVCFAVILILWRFPGLSLGAWEISTTEAKANLSKGITVYDVTKIIHKNEIRNLTDILPDTLYVQDGNTSARYYFVANDAAEDNLCWRKGHFDSYCWALGIKGLSIIYGDKVAKPDVLAMRDMPINTSTIVNLLQMDNSTSIDSITILLNDNRDCKTITSFHDKLVEYLTSSGKPSMKIGLEYDDEFIETCAGKWLSLFRTFDHTILRIHISSLTIFRPYQNFFDKVHGLIQKNRQLVKKVNPECALFVRVQNVDTEAKISDEIYDKYNALITLYLQTFSEQNTGDEIFIFNPTSKLVHIRPYNEFFRQSASAYYYNLEDDEYNFSEDKNLRACAHHQMMNLMALNVQSVLVYDTNLKILRSLLTPCKVSAESAQKQLILPLNFSVTLILNMKSKSQIEWQVQYLLRILRNNPKGIKISKVCMDTAKAFNLNDTNDLTKVVNLLQSQGIEACCTHLDSKISTAKANTSPVVRQVIRNCGGLLNLSSEILQHFKVVVKKEDDLFTFLTEVHQLKQRFEGLYPGKTLTPSLSIFTRGKFSLKEHSSYCNPKNEEIINEYYQVVNSFANLHGWSKVVSDTTHVGFWSYIKTDEQINQFELGFTVPFRSNAPQTGSEKLSMTYPCIQRSEDASQSQINFLLNQHSGATFHTDLRKTPPISTKEIQTLLKLALGRFSSVEIITGSRKDFRLVENVLFAHPPTTYPSTPNTSMPLVYVEVPIASGFQQEICKLLSINNHTAIHVSNWESLSSEQLNLWKGHEYSSTLNFGVTFENCSRKVNSTVVTLKSLPFMSQVKFVVCNVAPVVPTNLNMDWMEEYFGTLFYTKSYMEHFSSIGREKGNEVEVMFRLNYICSETNEMEPYLRFLNDINQHSAAYKIKYFLAQAFDGESSSPNCSISWWRLDSYADLSNISTFINREDEYAGREARIPYRPPVAAVQEQNSKTVYFIVIVPIVAVLLLVILAQYLYQRKQKTKILTEREIRLFYNGGSPSAAGNNYVDFENMKFPKNYEIPFKDIQTEEIVGSGQFGVVNRGILSKRIEVAVKIPRSDCGKEQFKSTLSELKILCHIGEHLNIVSFLGACTKGIANGNLYIVIEYCKNGCLLKYLRENRENKDEDSSISLYEMNGFALQIASGMEYIAEKRVIHGDLAARNVLLTSEMTCKIADFGLSRRLYEMNEYVKSSQEPLPWRWMAPESLRDMQFTTMSDVWSYGVTPWEVFSLGMVPYPGLSWTVNYVGELENGMRMGKAPHATDNIHAKTLDCWNLNAEERPTFTELKEYFVGLRNEQYLKLNQF